jgi:hypothetical protein
MIGTTIVEVEPLFDDGPAAMLAICEEVGSYRTYGDYERSDHPLGRGLGQRHDSVANFLRTGGLHASMEPASTLGARTSYFREEYAYGDRVRVPGIEAFLHHPRLVAAAAEVHGRPVVEPAIAYANLMVPGQELAVHTDVPEFRGINRKRVPQWLLVVMHHSELFDRWRLHIATGISWYQDSDGGALVYWPDGPGGSPISHRTRANSALVLDTDSVFHGVDRVGVDDDDDAVVVPVVQRGSTLQALGRGRWAVRDPAGVTVEELRWEQLRFSVSWKAYCFADVAEQGAWRAHDDDLDDREVIARLVDDLVDRGVLKAGAAIDRELALAMIDTYVTFPSTSLTP